MNAGGGGQANPVGIFGGSFNPPHIAHVLACQFALTVWPLDRVIVVPSLQHPFDKELVPYVHRLEMARLAFGPMAPRVEVSGIEGELGGVSYTVRTVEELARRMPGVPLRLVVGSDLVDEIPRWREAARLVEIAPLLVVPRPRTSAEAEAGFALPALSSTSIREALAAGGPPPLALPHAVAAYIRDRGLYAPTG